MTQLEKLEMLCHEQRWHRCSGGYRWRVVPLDWGGYEGVATHPDGCRLATLQHCSRQQCEDFVIKAIERHRAGAFGSRGR